MFCGVGGAGHFAAVAGGLAGRAGRARGGGAAPSPRLSALVGEGPRARRLALVAAMRIAISFSVANVRTNGRLGAARAAARSNMLPT